MILTFFGDVQQNVQVGMSCADPEILIRGGPTLTTFFLVCLFFYYYYIFFFFLVDEGKKNRYHHKRAIIAPLAKHHFAILMAFRWRADDGPTLNVD